jgi:outer membrane protein OmpA-like peptidoglycan-associated protein
MSRQPRPDALPSWAQDRSIRPVGPGASPPNDRRRLVFAFVAGVALMGVIGGAYALGRSNSDGSSTSADGVRVEVSSPSGGETTGGLSAGAAPEASIVSAPSTRVITPPTTTVADTSTAPSTAPAPTSATPTSAPPTSASPTTASPTTAAVVGEPAAPTAYGIYEKGKVYLRGRVPTREQADVIVAIAAGVVGPQNVADEYIIDPTATRPDDGPLYVADTVLFETSSNRIRAEFTQILDLGVVLMTQNPALTVEIIGHADSQGDPDTNDRLATQRAEAAKAYLVSKGIDGARLLVISKGDTEPLADNSTAEGRAINRRVSFTIKNLLGGA